MFKFAKYYVLLNLYKKTKKNIMRIMAFVLFMVMIPYIFSDIIVIMGNENSYALIVIKWLLYLTLLIIILFNVREILKVISSPFEKEAADLVSDEKKERILAKEYLMSRSNLIFEKYKDDACKNI